MTIQDCDVLVGKLTSDASLDDVLAAYQQERKAHDEDVVEHSLEVGRMQMMHSPIESWLRDEAFSHAPPDRMRAVAEAMATGE